MGQDYPYFCSYYYYSIVNYMLIIKLQRLYHFIVINRSSFQMFKVKSNQKSSNLIVNANPNTQKTSDNTKNNTNQLDIEKYTQRISHHHNMNLEKLQQSTHQQPNLLRNGSLRPRSGIKRNTNKNPSINTQSLNCQEEKQTKVLKPKISNSQLTQFPKRQFLQRPSTSSNQNIPNLPTQLNMKKQKLMNRKSNLSNKNNQFLRSHVNMNTHLNDQVSIDDQQSPSSYITNQQAQILIMKILDESQQYRRLRRTNEQSFQKIRNKILSNTSIIVLKWYKILQDQLYNQVRRIKSKDNTKQQNSSQVNDDTPYSSIGQFIDQQIGKQFSKQKGLFKIEQRCSKQQSKLQNMINKRLEGLESMLIKV